MKNFYLVCITLLALGVNAGLSSELIDEIESEIEQSVSQMSRAELEDKKMTLEDQKETLEDLEDVTQNPSTVKEIESLLDKINKALSAIDKRLTVLAAIAAFSAAQDDGYDRSIPPKITINGANPVTVELGSAYSDAGATAESFRGTSVSVTTSSDVNTSVVGSYTVTYSATDLNDNTTTATRTVNVEDSTAPVVTVTGENPATVELGETYTDAGATATDASGTVTVITSGSVDEDTIGTYTLTYTSTDASGNAGTATRTVNVVDTTAPVFTSQSTFIVDEGVTDIGAVTATDIQAVSFTISGTDLAITASGILTFISPADYEAQSDNPVTLPYDGSTYDITATVTATDESDNASTQLITVSIRDVGGLDDLAETGTGTNTSTATGTGTDTSTGTGTDTSTGTGTDTSTGTGTDTSTGTGTDTSTGTGTDTATATGTGTDTATATGTDTATATGSATGTGTGSATGTGTGSGTGT